MASMSFPIVKIDNDAPSLLLLFLYSLLMLYAPCRADLLDSYCPNTTSNYTTNTPFEANLKTLLISLSSNTSVSGFYNTSVGDGSNQVYGRALCRGDVTSEVCRNCVKNASREIIQKCPNKEDAIIWYESCQVHYTYKRFSMMVYAGKFPPWNDHEQNVSDPQKFIIEVRRLMTNLSNKAAFDPSGHMFATGDVNISGTVKLYGLVQCTRDISASSCEDCLHNAIGDIEGCCQSHRGGIILDTSCYLRYGIVPFYQASSPPSTITAVNGNRTKILKSVVLIIVPAVVVLVAFVGYFLWRRKGVQHVEESSQPTLLSHLGSEKGLRLLSGNFQEDNLVNPEEFHFMDLPTLRVATNNFSDSNKLGQGGFGTVYKGMLPDGKEIAVKRLSGRSWQGLEELKNEVILIAKLQHRNLVRLLGCGIEDEEKLLIYEFMPNTSLDVFIFDPERRSQLAWRTRCSIIDGIARGLLYLHEDSRLKIIHRDLKPSNVLLDHEMVAKISDFGMARIFGKNQEAANTRRVVGTFGYMAPEYAMAGLFSVKSDVFSFGVILLEIISGHKNNSFYHEGCTQTLLAYLWQLWKEGKELEFMDPLMTERCSTMEVLRCIHIGLLCVQEDAADRPSMSSVVTMLESDSVTLPEPNQPAFLIGRPVHRLDQSSALNCSVNEVTISAISAR